MGDRGRSRPAHQGGKLRQAARRELFGKGPMRIVIPLVLLVGCVACSTEGSTAGSTASSIASSIVSSTPGYAIRPAIIYADEWGSKPQFIPASRKHAPKFITIHHAGVLWRGGDPAQYIRTMQAWGQKEKSWP